MAIISEFYKRLRDLCEERNMTVNELVKVLKLSSGSPTAWKGGATPRLSTVQKIADYFHVSADYLLGNVSDPFFRLDRESILADINSYETENAPTLTEKDERIVSDEDIMFALWGDTDEVDKDDLDDVKRYAAFVRERKKKK